MANKFDLHQLLNERSRALAQQKPQEPPQAETMEQLTLDVYDLIPSKENFYDTGHIEDLKQSISLVGVLQPLLVRRDGDKYRIKAGHRRRLACMALADEGQEQFRFVPCVIRQEEEKEGNINAILDRLTLIFANGFREKTDWEKMEEALQTEALVVELRKEVALEGRTRSILADFTGIKEAQLGRYKAIKNNLCPQLMAAFKANAVGVSVVYELSGLSTEYQQRAYDLYKENGTLALSDAKALKKQEEAAQQIPGQMEWLPKQPGSGQQEPEEELPDLDVEEEEAVEPQEAAQEPQEAPEEEEAQEQDGERDKPQEAVQEAQETPQVVYVERQVTEKPHGCAFCHPVHHREISTMEGTYLLAYEPEERKVRVLDQGTGCVETIVFHHCPMCGRKLI